MYMTSPARTWYSTALYGMLIFIVLATKPKFAFHTDGTIRDFGMGTDRSVFSFGVLTSVSAILSSVTFAALDLASI
jgi:hypothetical protein